MNSNSPWVDIAIPNQDYNVRRINSTSLVPCFWGRDVNGKYLFIIEFEGDYNILFKNRIAEANGLHIDLRTKNDGIKLLVTALDSMAFLDIFEGFCMTLLKSIEHVESVPVAFSTATEHFLRWKSFLAGKNYLLSPNEIRGLYSELIFLTELINSSVSISHALDSWVGGERSQQDFIINNSAVEIKSLLGSERNNIRISSEDQLYSLNNYLFLRIYKLSIHDSSLKAKSLTGLIEQIYNLIPRENDREKFNLKLESYGYFKNPAYDIPLFYAAKKITYKVSGDFPSLISSNLPNGISNVSYDIDLNVIEGFIVPDEEILESILWK